MMRIERMQEQLQPFVARQQSDAEFTEGTESSQRRLSGPSSTHRLNFHIHPQPQSALLWRGAEISPPCSVPSTGRGILLEAAHDSAMSASISCQAAAFSQGLPLL